MDKHYYNVRVRWTSGRRGILCSPDVDGRAPENGCIETGTPPQFANGVEGVWSPEHLYAAAVASCFMTTFLAIAENSKLEFTEFECEADGILEFPDNRPLMTAVILRATLTIVNENDEARAKRVLEKSEKACLISNSIRSDVTLETTIRIVETGLADSPT